MTQPDQDLRAEQPDWEAFYANYRKPGYIDGFEIQEKLGGGMFGLVFKARRMSIGKDYAIKFLQVDDMEVRRAVLGELEQVKYFAQIDHPNLVSIEDRGEVDGIPFLVMAYAGNETLRDRMPEGTAPAPEQKGELVRAFLQCCRGLQALHERSLVHFDIKPANVFLKGSVARLGDYGLSKLVTHSRGSLSMGRGTPYYMAPEMLQRRGDARSDVYSLGIMLYEILCGRVPFAGDSEWEVLRQHEEKAPELPAHLTAAERAILNRCLAKDPGDRFQSVQDLIVAYGAPASAGAAAYADPVERSHAAAPPPPPGLDESQRAREESKDAYKAMAEASKEAMRHANVVARHAVRDAKKVAKKAADNARKLWSDSVGKTRNYGLRRWEALKRLRKQKNSVLDRQEMARIATEIAKAPKRRRRRRGLVLTFTFGSATLLVILGLLAVYWTAGVNYSGHSAYGVAVADAREVPGPSRAPTYDFSRVPSRFDALVSNAEPRWAGEERNARQAKRLLLEHIEALRDYAPMTPNQRRRHKLPQFQISKRLPDVRDARNDVQAFLERPEYDHKIARLIVNRGPVGLAAAAEAMADLEWQDSRSLRSAKRLQNLLVQATGCRDLQLVENAESLATLAAYNQPLGELWCWFVNEFAHTERSWRAYRKLLNQ